MARVSLGVPVLTSAPVALIHRALPPLPRRAVRRLHATAVQSANPLPITAAGPPPSAPLPSALNHSSRVDRRRRQADLLRKGRDARAALPAAKGTSALNRRFWKDVSVQTDDDGHHTVHLDARSVRHPSIKQPLQIPASKPHLATAVALEWDMLTSAQQALKPHLMPLTALVARAHDIAQDDAAPVGGKGREDIVRTVMRYLDTDTLLCWAPSAGPSYAAGFRDPETPRGTQSLHAVQSETAAPIVRHLTTYVWPGTEMHPALPDDAGGVSSILPRPQPATTHAVARGWATSLGPWELAGLERAVLAGKSLCVAARLVSEWSEGGAGVRTADSVGAEAAPAEAQRFGADEAAKACSLEVRWQTGMWGEVEDSHDVDREDLRRHMGSVVLLVGGEGAM